MTLLANKVLNNWPQEMTEKLLTVTLKPQKNLTMNSGEYMRRSRTKIFNPGACKHTAHFNDICTF